MIGFRSFFASLLALGALFFSASPALAQTVIVSRPGYGPYYGPPPGPYYAPYPPPRYVPPPPAYVPPPPPPPAYVPPPPPPPPVIIDRGYWGFTLSGAGLYSIDKDANGYSLGVGLRTFSRISPLDAELELGFGRYDDIRRNDYRLGLNIHASLSKGVVVPYIVAPLALHVTTAPTAGTHLEGSAGLGLGLGVRFWRMMISADARMRYQDDFNGEIRDDWVGEGRVTVSIFPWNL